jgi:hypothetical protein
VKGGFPHAGNRPHLVLPTLSQIKVDDDGYARAMEVEAYGCFSCTFHFARDSTNATSAFAQLHGHRNCRGCAFLILSKLSSHHPSGPYSALTYTAPINLILGSHRKEAMYRPLMFLLISAISTAGQSLPDKPQPMVQVSVRYLTSDHPFAKELLTLPVPHRTEDKAWWTWQASAVAATGGDLAFGISHLGSEANPLVHKHPVIACSVAGATTVVFALVSRTWKREDDALRAVGPESGIKWWVPNLIETALHGAGLITSIVAR